MHSGGPLPQGSTVAPIKHRHAYVQALYVVCSAFVIFLGAQLVGAVLVSVVGGLVFGTGGDAMTNALENNITVRFLLTLAIELLTVWFVYSALKAKKLSLKSIGISKELKASYVVEALKGYALYFVIFLSVLTVVGALGIIDTNQSQQLGFNNPTGFGLVLTFLSLVILPPISEEVLFRGYLNQRLKAHVPVIAAVVTSVLFSVAHLEFGTGSPLNWAAALDTLILSFVLIRLTDHTKSLWPAIFLHTIKNAIAFTSLFLLK